MYSKLKTLFFILTCFTLLSCPPSHFHKYTYIGEALPSDTLAFTFDRIEFNEETDVYIKCGYYYEFINEKENGITAIIKFSPNFDWSKNDVVKDVNSSTFGKLEKRNTIPYTIQTHDTINTRMYNLRFEKRIERLSLKKVENDTIIVEFTNAKRLLFVKKGE